MKKKKSEDVHQKVIIVSNDGVSEEFIDRVRKRYPKAFVKTVRANAVLTEARTFGKRVSYVVCTPDVIKHCKEYTSYWTGCIAVNADNI